MSTPISSSNRRASASLFSRPDVTKRAVVDSFRKLDPRAQIRNPVMFVVYVGSILTSVIGIAAVAGRLADAGRPGFVLAVSMWLWLTVLSANFAEAVAEGRGKAQADTLRKTRTEKHTERRPARPEDSVGAVEVNRTTQG